MLSSQQFENNFFQLIEIQERIRNGARFNTAHCITWLAEFENLTTKVVEGIELFSVLAEDFNRFYKLDDELISPKIKSRVLHELFGPAKITVSKDSPIDRIKAVYKDFYGVYEDQIAHYMRNLYHMLKYVDSLEKQISGLTEIEISNRKKLYSDMIQSQLSSAEMSLIFYNGICFQKMKELIEKFNLLENLRPQNLADEEKHKLLYSFELKSLPF